MATYIEEGLAKVAERQAKLERYPESPADLQWHHLINSIRDRDVFIEETLNNESKRTMEQLCEVIGCGPQLLAQWKDHKFYIGELTSRGLAFACWPNIRHKRWESQITARPELEREASHFHPLPKMNFQWTLPSAATSTGISPFAPAAVRHAARRLKQIGPEAYEEERRNRKECIQQLRPAVRQMFFGGVPASERAPPLEQ